MKIGIDLRPFLRFETGVGTYIKNLLFSLSSIDMKNDYYLFSSSFKQRFSPSKIPFLNKMHFRDYHYPVKLLNFLWYRQGWPPLDFFFKTRLDLTHSPTPLICPTKGKAIITVHDLFFMDFPYKANPEARRFFYKNIHKSLQDSDGIIVVSHFIKNQLLEKFKLPKEKIKVIYHGVDSGFSSDISLEEINNFRESHSLPSRLIVFVGAMDPRKNLLNLIQAFQIVHSKEPEVSLVIAGKKGQDYLALKKKIHKSSLDENVKILDYLSLRDLKRLYRAGTLFVFPSYCEGFGLPLLEAMVSEMPVVASNRTALPEIAGSAALYFDPEQPEDMASAILKLLWDSDLRNKYIGMGRERVRQFSWESTAKSTLNFYQHVAQQK
ncbi:MAG: glycosyltransferase [Candidatus Aminicenantes bacterium]|nr:glycosyltransferase [Candidatus Aminicenantes bacterium]